MSNPNISDQGNSQLRRRLTLPLLVLYGLGVTVGAGIYVLVGTTASLAGMYAPVSFLCAAAVVAFTGFSYAELSASFPVSAGEAAYVRAGLHSNRLALLAGIMVALVGIVSAAAIMVGASAYLQDLLGMNATILAICVAIVLGLTAIWGVLESVTTAAIFTVVEFVGLLLVIAYGVGRNPELLGDVAVLIPPFEVKAWTGIGAASVLAFFAFVGFEDLANIAEEAVEPDRNMPRAIIWTLVLATALYLAVVSVVVLTVPIETLANSAAPLNLVFSDAEPATRTAFNLIAAVATLNGVLIQMIMSSRVIYGLAKQEQLPQQLASVNPKTKTPIRATVLVTALVLALCLFFPIERLAEATSQIALAIFAMVNLALIRLKRDPAYLSRSRFPVHISVPVMGLLTCIALFMIGLL